MRNTVLLRGKGLGVAIFFYMLLSEFPDAKLTEPKLKWWQSTTRYELRLQNLPLDDIINLQYSINVHYPLSSYIHMDVF